MCSLARLSWISGSRKSTGLSSSSSRWLGRIPKPQAGICPCSRNWSHKDRSFPMRSDCPAAILFALFTNQLANTSCFLEFSGLYLFLWEVVIWIQGRSAEDISKAPSSPRCDCISNGKWVSLGFHLLFQMSCTPNIRIGGWEDTRHQANRRSSSFFSLRGKWWGRVEWEWMDSSSHPSSAMWSFIYSYLLLFQQKQGLSPCYLLWGDTRKMLSWFWLSVEWWY